MLTMRPPPPRAISWGIAARQGRNVPITLTSSTLRNASGLDILRRGLDRPGDPGRVDEDVESAEALDRSRDQLLDLGHVGDVAGHGGCLCVGKRTGQAGDVLLERRDIAAGDNDVGSVTRRARKRSRRRCPSHRRSRSRPCRPAAERCRWASAPAQCALFSSTGRDRGGRNDLTLGPNRAWIRLLSCGESNSSPH